MSFWGILSTSSGGGQKPGRKTLELCEQDRRETQGGLCGVNLRTFWSCFCMLGSDSRGGPHVHFVNLGPFP